MCPCTTASVPSYEQWAEDNPPDLVDAGKHIESGAFDDAVARNPDFEPYIRAVQKNAPVPPPAMTAERIVKGTARAFKKDIQSDVAWWKKLWKNIGWLGEEMYGDYPEAYTEWPWQVGPMPPGVGQRTRTEGIIEQTLRIFGSRNEWNDWYPQQQLEHAASARDRMQQGAGGAR